jgi:hypothetical protein
VSHQATQHDNIIGDAGWGPFPAVPDEGFWRLVGGTHEALRALAASAAGAVVTMTTTTQARVDEVKGCGIENPGQRYA